MSRGKILVPLVPENEDLKGVYHALALAERIKAKIYIIFLHHVDAGKSSSNRIEQACLEIISRAREDGTAISCHLAHLALNDYEKALLRIIEEEYIDLIIISYTEKELERIIRKIMPLISCKVIQVKGKDNVNRLY